MEQRIETMDAGFSSIIKHLLSENYQIIETIPINRGRYKIVKTNKGNLLIMFKREVFFNFGKEFALKGLKGVGDTINCDDLKNAIISKVKKIYTIFPNGNIYSIDLKKFLLNSERWINKEGKQVRSISIHEYERENED